MRPLPLEAMPDLPSFVVGVSIIRGVPTPVVDLARLVVGDGGAHDERTRLVTVRSSTARRVGLLVDAVYGLRQQNEMSDRALPPLLRDAARDVVDDVARLDGELLTLLRSSSLCPEQVWESLADGKS